MRRIAVMTVSILLLVAIHFGVSGQDTGAKVPPKAGTQPAVPRGKPGTPPAKEPLPSGALTTPNAAKNPAPKDQVTDQSADEMAIRKTAETYLKAFNQANAKAAADHFTADAEYVDDQGKLIQGRAAIEKSLKELFAEYPECKYELRIDAIRFVGPGVAVEDGMTTLTRSKTADPVVDHYTATHVKDAGKWLVASVRDFSPKQRQHRNQLRQLDWMLGDWVHEGNDAVVHFSCKPVDNGNFLLRTFTIKTVGQEEVSGSQRTGWDPLMRKFRSWIFDSAGGYSEGYWHRDGDSWVLKTSGVTADGQAASTTSTYSSVNAHTMTFQSVDHEVGGIELPDGPKVTIVRHPPKPE